MDGLQRVIEQFVGLLSSRQISEQDQQDLTELIRKLSLVEGDYSRLLREHPAMQVTASWYAHKYSIIATDQARKATQKLNEIYTRNRERGHDEWTAKRMAECHTEYTSLLGIQDSCHSISEMLVALSKVCEQRLRVLEQLSNNYRSESRIGA